MEVFKKQVVFGLIAISVTAILLSVELVMAGSSSRNIPNLNSSFVVPADSQEQLEIVYELGSSAQKYLPNYRLAPKQILTKTQAAKFKIFDSANFVIAPETTLTTLVFTNSKYHADLTTGSIIFSNKTEVKPVTLQVGNIVIEPYSPGTFFVSKINNQIQVNILDGNAEVGVYSKTGQIQRKLMLSKFNQISAFDGFAEEGDIEIQKLVKNSPAFDDLIKYLPTVQSLISTESVFTLLYKGYEIKPESPSWFKQLLTDVTFNPNKKNLNTISQFYAELNRLILQSEKRAVTKSDIANLDKIYADTIANNIEALELFRGNLLKKYPYILAIDAESNLYELKLYLNDYLTFVPTSAKVMSALEDLYLLYPQNKIVQLSETTDYLSSIVPDLGKSDSLNIIAILDNLVESTIQANTKDVFDLRSLASAKLTTTIEKAQFRTNSQQHLLRIENALESSQITPAQAKGAVESLVKNLDPLAQAKYQDLLLRLN